MAVDPAAKYARRPEIRLREIDGAGFLADSETQGIFHLNETGVAIVRLLENPITTDEITDLMCQAFPAADRAQIVADVTSLIDRLAEKDLIVRAS